MLRTYGRLTRSLSAITKHAPSTALSLTTIPRPISPSFLRVASTKATKKLSDTDENGKAKSLAELQASLEEAGYGPRRKPRTKRKPKDDDGEAHVKPRGTRTCGINSSPSNEETTTTPRRCRRKSTQELPPRLLPTSQKHHDLASFLAHAEKTGLSTTSTVYRGTHFEYTVAQSLQSFDFVLQRTGRSNDLGIDLVGHWKLPTANVSGTGKKEKDSEHAMPVLVQCKASKLSPARVRELEGAYVGAPAGWRGEGVLAVLISTQPATKGVSAAIQRSQWPLAVMQITREGVVKQMVWNAKAAEVGLEGLSVHVRYQSGVAGGEKNDVEQSIGLTWLGRAWRPEIKRIDVQQQNVQEHEGAVVAAAG